ncbi:MAG: hypothetical protein A2381_05035 [Bdellovibrionales bacterium RIFOXYB1_FULL_37_110]|nr:MAG: hypothetical protein A2417_16515 [Bdellovibrionales bacterium RIFOXYC1_FULL_37_79]OFZ58113.1 MAG: hypothetical protein A2381_05035 [Bdellovibrionales bacterium RIFOXYB1_FULL_37_110]OFZ61802.1 MAG: hypothetical protein A2577_18620 [Bdellovibrionales bacterium RIFOXYD1_FULL_36_51]
MKNRTIDLRGKVCPFPIMEVISIVDEMNPLESVSFQIDDPLALKSIPEELSDYADLKICIKKITSYWEITINKS